MAEASNEALNFKTLYLKVSIHCEGCKKKVRRVLQNIEGVYKVDIDSFQHKVTVTCTVDHDTLIRKLLKSGKQASVWPEAKKAGGNQTANTSNDSKNQNKESNSKPKENSETNSKEKQPEPAKEKSSDKGDEKEKEKEKPKTEDETKSKPQEKEKEKDGVKEKPKEKGKEKEKAKEQPEQEGKQNSSGENKKEKKEEKEKKNESSAKEGGQQVEKGFSPSQPKQEFMYQPYPQPYYPYQPQPIMSYHAVQPSSSQAYYQQPPMPGTQGYMHPYPEPNPYQYQHQYQYQYGTPSEFNYGTTESSSTRGEDTLSIFNEENANSCSVM